MKKLMILSTVLLLAACSSDELSKSQVQKAINHSVKNRDVCIPFALNVENRHDGDVTQLGSEKILLLKRLENGKRANLAAIEEMDILVNAGLYQQEKTVREGEGENTIRFLSYHLTEKGQKTFIPTPHGPLLCIGHENVEKVNYFTKPTPANGLTVSKVSYEAKIIPERWAKKLLKNSSYDKNIQQTQTKFATLVQTNDGWRDIRSLN